MSIKVSLSCLNITCARHNKNKLKGCCKMPELVAIGNKGKCLWASRLKPCIEAGIDCVGLCKSSNDIAQKFMTEVYVMMEKYGKWEGISQEDEVSFKMKRPSEALAYAYDKAWEGLQIEARFVNNNDNRVFVLQVNDGRLYLVLNIDEVLKRGAMDIF